MKETGGYGNSWIEYRFENPRFIQTVTLIGNAESEFANSKDWFLSVGDATGPDVIFNQRVGEYTTDDDKFGKEFIVRIMAKSVAVFKNPELNEKLQFRGILVTSTDSDCTGNFDWSGSKSDWPGSPTANVSGIVKATIGDCAISYKADLDDGSILPDFIIYHPWTTTLEIYYDA